MIIIDDYSTYLQIILFDCDGFCLFLFVSFYLSLFVFLLLLFRKTTLVFALFN